MRRGCGPLVAKMPMVVASRDGRYSKFKNGKRSAQPTLGTDCFNTDGNSVNSCIEPKFNIRLSFRPGAVSAFLHALVTTITPPTINKVPTISCATFTPALSPKIRRPTATGTSTFALKIGETREIGMP
jgi:hypothetical protein